ncbi:hypothetical protein H311_00278 [Anncaliia algerae PRA109]|nr:hypothetical protein H311_00278 [Anncaliia algerae PRA109]
MSHYQNEILNLRYKPQKVLIERLMSLGLIQRSFLCSYCEMEMLLRNKKTHDEYAWVCNNLCCEFYRTTRSIRSNSIFEDFRCSIMDVYLIIYSWSIDKPIKSIVTEFDIPKRTIIKIYKILRSLVNRHLEADPIRLGGINKVCQIDESLFCHKVKAHRGRAPETSLWVFGIVDTSFSPAKGYMEIVPDRSARTLLPIIRKVCKPGTIIHSDEWSAYGQIQSQLGFIHKTVNHSYYFVDPDTNTHTQNIESYWNKQKLKLKALRGVRRADLPFYIAEFIWKENYKNDIFNTLIEVIKIYY